MRRFNYDDGSEDFKDEVDNFFPDFGGEEEAEYMGRDDIINMLHIDLAEYDLNQKVLTAAIRLCEKTLFWRFRSIKTKLRMLDFIYKNLLELLKADSDEEEEEGDDKPDTEPEVSDKTGDD